jgi:hypothetical protein
MNWISACVLVALGCFLGAPAASAQDVSRYRGYVLESSLESVVVESGVRAEDVKTVHQRPATIHELEWRAPYSGCERELADPVHDIAFTFYNEALYQIVVSYDRDRTDGLTSNDIIESLTLTYGAPVARSARIRPASALRESVVLAQWENDASSVTLLRDGYSPEFQLILISKGLSARARDAIRQGVRLDAIEAPRRELEQRKQEAADTSAARAKTRTTNKAAFRP